jgi:membrane protease YdiL (CAAX protease family)
MATICGRIFNSVYNAVSIQAKNAIHGVEEAGKFFFKTQLPMGYICDIAGKLFPSIAINAPVPPLLLGCVVGPVVEEVIFRVAIKKILNKTFSLIVSEEKAKFASRIVNSVIFGAAHSYGLWGMLAAFSAYKIYDPLKDSHGIVASIFAHTTHNFLCVLPTLF